MLLMVEQWVCLVGQVDRRVVDGGSMRFFLVLSWLLFFFFFFFINCAGVLGLHSGDGGDEW